jgi:hypothetical protein
LLQRDEGTIREIVEGWVIPDRILRIVSPAARALTCAAADKLPYEGILPRT